jgi:GDP-L-fucose synthase
LEGSHTDYKYPAQMLFLNASMAINLYKACYENGVKRLINPISNCAYPGNLMYL